MEGLALEDPLHSQPHAVQAVPLDRLQNGDTSPDVMSALTGDYEQSERSLRDSLQAKAQSFGFEMSPAASLRATLQKRTSSM